jgi:hypothetical protein
MVVIFSLTYEIGHNERFDDIHISMAKRHKEHEKHEPEYHCEVLLPKTTRILAEHFWNHL